MTSFWYKFVYMHRAVFEHRIAVFVVAMCVAVCDAYNSYFIIWPEVTGIFSCRFPVIVLVVAYNTKKCFRKINYTTIITAQRILSI